MLSSTPLRRSLHKKLNESILTSPILSESNDDDDERRKRRSMYENERRLSKAFEINSLRPEDIVQIKHQITLCQKLFNENKITIRNAWDVKIIDYVNEYVSAPVANTETMLIAAYTLDVCIKVYGYKIEYLGQEIVKLINAVHSSSTKDTEHEIPEQNSDDEEIAAKSNKKKKRTKFNIVKDRNSLLCTTIPKVAPTHFTGSTDIYANNFENMFAYKIPMDHSGYKYCLLDNMDPGFVSYEMKDQTIQEKSFIKTVPEINSFTICPEFKTFNIDEEDEYNDSLLFNSFTTNEVVYDENGAPLPNLDGSVQDVFEDDADVVDDVDDENKLAEQRAQARMEMITSFIPTSTTVQRNNTSTSNTFLEELMYGPSYWKNKFIRQSVPQYSGKAEKKVTQLTKRKEIVQEKETQINLSGAVDIDLTDICKTTRRSWDPRKCTLPPANLLEVPNFKKLILMDVIPQKEYLVNNNNNELEFEYSPYDYNNPDDSQYCPLVEVPGRNDDSGEDRESNNSEEQNDVAKENDMDAVDDNLPLCSNTIRNLIDAPDVVTQTYIPYAVRAKKVNMKQLKSGMLDCLKKDNLCDGEDVAGVADIQKVKPTLFSDIYKDLRSNMPEKKRRDISVPLVFFTLLHITNEHNLELRGFESLTDFEVSKP